MFTSLKIATAALATAVILPLATPLFAAETSEVAVAQSIQTRYGSADIEGLNIAYREAGNPSNPAIVLLHGFPTSSQMFKDLIPQLADQYYVLAPDYPGFGASSMPLAADFDYSFDTFARLVTKLIDQKGITTYTAYVMDYGAPVGYRMFAENPERVNGFIIQNGNAYAEGLREFWDPIKAYWAEPTAENGDKLRGFFALDATKWQYTAGTRNPEAINPDNLWNVQYLLDRPGNQEIQLELFLDYGTNLAEYPKWQALFREHQPPALIVWGKNDPIFPADGAHPYKRDLEDLEFHLYDTGHFALEEDGGQIAAEIRDFMARITDQN